MKKAILAIAIVVLFVGVAATQVGGQVISNTQQKCVLTNPQQNGPYYFKFVRGFIEEATLSDYDVADDLGKYTLYEDVHFRGIANPLGVDSAFGFMLKLNLPDVYTAPDLCEVQIDMNFFFGQIIDHGTGVTGHVYELKGLGVTIGITEY
jgi:hypothetical protein